jgi:PAS domain S-box-containing protein
MDTGKANLMKTINTSRDFDTAALLDYVTESIVICDKETKVIYANQATKTLLGYTVEELHKMKLFDIVHPDDKKKVKEYRKQMEKVDHLVTIRRMKKKNGEYVFIERNARVLDDGGTISILRDVTDRQAFEQRKDTFISIASHELRNPVNTIGLYLETAEAALSEEDKKKALQSIQKVRPQIERLNNLISDMLDVSKMQTGKMEFRMGLFNLVDIVREAASQLIGTAKRKFHIDIQGKIQNQVYGDRDRIHQVITNLLTNAIKYSPHSDHIIISMIESADKVEVKITDFGIGIKLEEQKNIFERFYQVPGSSKYASGMGIGLFLSRDIIRKHGGDLTVKSVYGEGSSFSFFLPKKNI